MAVNKLIKYFKLFLLFVKINYLRSMEYRINFVSAFLPSVLYSLGYLVFMGSILDRVPSVSGWDFDKMLLLFAVGQFIYYTQWIFYRSSLAEFSQSVNDGSFDAVAKLPVNTRFMVSFRKQAPNVVVPFVFALLLFIYALRNTTLLIPDVLIFLFLIACGFLIYYNICFTFATLAFYIIDADDLLWFADDITRFGSYPLEIFPPLARAFLLYIVPVMFLAYIPVTALIGIFHWETVFLSIAMVAATTLVSQKFWQMGLRHYSSASS